MRIERRTTRTTLRRRLGEAFVVALTSLAITGPTAASLCFTSVGGDVLEGARSTHRSRQGVLTRLFHRRFPISNHCACRVRRDIALTPRFIPLG